MKQVKNIFNKVVLALPVATTASLAVVGAGLILLILSDSYSNLLISLVIILAGLPVFLYVTYKFNDNGPGSDREKLILSIFMLIFAAIWIIYNAPFAAQNVFIDRDPGIYTVAGKHLVNNSTTNVKVEKIFGNDSKILAHEGGFWPKANTEDSAIIQPQGAHLLPAFLSLGGRLAATGYCLKSILL